jgi:peptidoglycan hydrolase-like protein with peptidoglycan-binding domain
LHFNRTGSQNIARIIVENSLWLDSIAPTLTSAVIMDNSGYTNDATPEITIISSGSPSYIAFSCDGGTNWSSWRIYPDDDVVNDTDGPVFDITSGATGCSSANESKTINVKLKDAYDNETTNNINDITFYDTSLPTNNGLFSITADSSTQLTVTTQTVVDSDSGLHSTPYWFSETLGNTGASSSIAWQVSTDFIDTGLSPNTQYTYKVKAKDAVGNESSYSSTLSKYTLSNIPTSLSLTSDSATQITASWNANSNPASTQYYIENTTAGTNSGWTTSVSWISSDLNCGTDYSFKVKSRNGDNAETAFTSTVSVETQGCGGGLSPSAYTPPVPPESTLENPEGGFGVAILRQAQDDNDNTIVTLKLFAGADTKRMAISNTPDFASASQIPYQEIISWDLDKNIQYPVSNIRVVYIKFYTQYGVASEVVSDSVILKTADTEEQTDDSNQDKPESETEDPESSKDAESDKTNPSQSSLVIFTKTLQFGSNNNQVIQLQNKLKELNFFPKEIKSNGNFGPATKNAVKEYQKSKEIYPCGIVGPRTRKAFNNEEFITNKDYQFTQDLKYNDKSEEVKQLQARLKDQNFFPHYIKPTGYFGSITQKAVNIFQKFYNLIQSGIVDEGMREVLN